MLRVKSVLFQNNTIRWLVWLAVVLILIAIFLIHYNRNHEKVIRTKAVMVGQAMQQRVNQLHQLWLLNKQPSQLKVDGRVVEFDSSGWINLYNNNAMNCDYLLSVLYPNGNGGRFKLVTRRQKIAKNSFVCIYKMDEIAQIKVHKIKSLYIKIIM